MASALVELSRLVQRLRSNSQRNRQEQGPDRRPAPATPGSNAYRQGERGNYHPAINTQRPERTASGLYVRPPTTIGGYGEAPEPARSGGYPEPRGQGPALPPRRPPSMVTGTQYVPIQISDYDRIVKKPYQPNYQPATRPDIEDPVLRQQIEMGVQQQNDIERVRHDQSVLETPTFQQQVPALERFGLQKQLAAQKDAALRNRWAQTTTEDKNLAVQFKMGQWFVNGQEGFDTNALKDLGAIDPEQIDFFKKYGYVPGATNPFMGAAPVRQAVMENAYADMRWQTGWNDYRATVETMQNPVYRLLYSGAAGLGQIGKRLGTSTMNTLNWLETVPQAVGGVTADTYDLKDGRIVKTEDSDLTVAQKLGNSFGSVWKVYGFGNNLVDDKTGEPISPADAWGSLFNSENRSRIWHIVGEDRIKHEKVLQDANRWVEEVSKDDPQMAALLRRAITTTGFGGEEWQTNTLNQLADKYQLHSGTKTDLFETAKQLQAAGKTDEASATFIRANSLDEHTASDIMEMGTQPAAWFVASMLGDPSNFVPVGLIGDAVRLMKVAKGAEAGVDVAEAAKLLTKADEFTETFRTGGKLTKELMPSAKSYGGRFARTGLLAKTADAQAHMDTNTLGGALSTLVRGVDNAEDFKALTGTWATDPVQLTKGVTGLTSKELTRMFTPEGELVTGAASVMSQSIMERQGILRLAYDNIDTLPSMSAPVFDVNQARNEFEGLIYKTARQVHGVEAIDSLPYGATKLVTEGNHITYLNDAGELVGVSREYADAATAAKTAQLIEQTIGTGGPRKDIWSQLFKILKYPDQIQRSIMSTTFLNLTLGQIVRNGTGAATGLGAEGIMSFRRTDDIIKDLGAKFLGGPTPRMGQVMADTGQSALTGMQTTSQIKNPLLRAIDNTVFKGHHWTGTTHVLGIQNLPMGEQAFYGHGWFGAFHKYFDKSWGRGVAKKALPGLAAIGTDEQLARKIVETATDVGINGSAPEMVDAIRALVSSPHPNVTLKQLGLQPNHLSVDGWKQAQQLTNSFNSGAIDWQALAGELTQIIDHEAVSHGDILLHAPAPSGPLAWMAKEAQANGAHAADDIAAAAKSAGWTPQQSNTFITQVVSPYLRSEEDTIASITAAVKQSADPASARHGIDAWAAIYDARQQADDVLLDALADAQEAGTAQAYATYLQTVQQQYAGLGQTLQGILGRSTDAISNSQPITQSDHWWGLLDRVVGYDNATLARLRKVGGRQGDVAGRQWVDGSYIGLLRSASMNPVPEAIDILSNAFKKNEQMGAALGHYTRQLYAAAADGTKTWAEVSTLKNKAYNEFYNAVVTNNRGAAQAIFVHGTSDIPVKTKSVIENAVRTAEQVMEEAAPAAGAPTETAAAVGEIADEVAQTVAEAAPVEAVAEAAPAEAVAEAVPTGATPETAVPARPAAEQALDIPENPVPAPRRSTLERRVNAGRNRNPVAWPLPEANRVANPNRNVPQVKEFLRKVTGDVGKGEALWKKVPALEGEVVVGGPLFTDLNSAVKAINAHLAKNGLIKKLAPYKGAPGFGPAEWFARIPPEDRYAIMSYLDQMQVMRGKYGISAADGVHAVITEAGKIVKKNQEGGQSIGNWVAQAMKRHMEEVTAENTAILQTGQGVQELPYWVPENWYNTAAIVDEVPPAPSTMNGLPRVGQPNVFAGEPVIHDPNTFTANRALGLDPATTPAQAVQQVADETLAAGGGRHPTAGDVGGEAVSQMRRVQERLMNGMAQAQVAAAPANAGITPAQSRQIMDYVTREIVPLFDNHVASSSNLATKLADSVMINPEDRRYIDAVAAIVFPYHFFWSRSAKNWAGRAIRKPAWTGALIEISKAQDLENAQLGEGQNRYKNTFPIWYRADGTPIRLQNPVQFAFPLLSLFNQYVRPEDAKGEADLAYRNLMYISPGLFPLYSMFLNDRLDKEAPLPDGEKRASWNMAQFIPQLKLAANVGAMTTGDPAALLPGNGRFTIPVGTQAGQRGSWLGVPEALDYNVGNQLAREAQGATPDEITALRYGRQMMLNYTNETDPYTNIPPEYREVARIQYETAMKTVGLENFMGHLSFFIGFNMRQQFPEDKEIANLNATYSHLGYDPVNNPYGSDAAKDAYKEAHPEIKVGWDRGGDSFAGPPGLQVQLETAKALVNQAYAGQAADLEEALQDYTKSIGGTPTAAEYKQIRETVSGIWQPQIDVANDLKDKVQAEMDKQKPPEQALAAAPTTGVPGAAGIEEPTAAPGTLDTSRTLPPVPWQVPPIATAAGAAPAVAPAQPFTPTGELGTPAGGIPSGFAGASTPPAGFAPTDTGAVPVAPAAAALPAVPGGPVATPILKGANPTEARQKIDESVFYAAKDLPGKPVYDDIVTLPYPGQGATPEQWDAYHAQTDAFYKMQDDYEADQFAFVEAELRKQYPGTPAGTKPALQGKALQAEWEKWNDRYKTDTVRQIEKEQEAYTAWYDKTIDPLMKAKNWDGVIAAFQKNPEYLNRAIRDKEAKGQDIPFYLGGPDKYADSKGGTGKGGKYGLPAGGRYEGGLDDLLAGKPVANTEYMGKLKQAISDGWDEETLRAFEGYDKNWSKARKKAYFDEHPLLDAFYKYWYDGMSMEDALAAAETDAGSYNAYGGYSGASYGYRSYGGGGHGGGGGGGGGYGRGDGGRWLAGALPRAVQIQGYQGTRTDQPDWRINEWRPLDSMYGRDWLYAGQELGPAKIRGISQK